MISYADFVTLLFAFFVTMYAISQVDVKKLGHLSESLQVAFKIIPIPTTVTGKLPADLGDLKIRVINPLNPAQISPFPSMSKKEYEKLKRLQKTLEKFLIKDGSKEIDIGLSERGLEVHLREKVLFDSGEAELRLEATSILDKLAQNLLLVPNLIRIEGHTDNIPINTSRFPSNWELSTARAAAVVRYFMDRHNFSPLRLSIAGYGPYYPIASNDNLEGRAFNRRVDLIILSSNLERQEPKSSTFVSEDGGSIP